MNNVSLFSALIAGFLTFLSPCVLPLIPGYISFISGSSLTELKQQKIQAKTLINAVFFILGFSLVFILLGASATFLGKFLLSNLRILNKVGGILIILFGLHLSGILKLKLLNFEERFHLRQINSNPWVAFLLGIAFAFGWSPCIGPILASILILAGNQETLAQGIFLLTVYALGLAIPFLLTALAINQFFVFFNKIKKYFGIIEIGSGILLIILGYLIFTNQMTKLLF